MWRWGAGQEGVAPRQDAHAEARPALSNKFFGSIGQHGKRTARRPNRIVSSLLGLSRCSTDGDTLIGEFCGVDYEATTEQVLAVADRQNATEH